MATYINLTATLKPRALANSTINLLTFNALTNNDNANETDNGNFSQIVYFR